MSKTDKTRPYWVQLTDDTFHVVEDHDHRHGPCDLDQFDPEYENRPSLWRRRRADGRPVQRCQRHIPYYRYSGGAWARRRCNSWAKEEARQYEGGFRTLWRSKHRPGLIADPDGYEGDIRPRHRHQMLWDMW